MDRVASGASSWFPGQMARTRRLIRENLSLVGLVIEVADARAPRATRHPGLDKLVPGRPILTVLAKSDLADPEATARWERWLSEHGRPGDAAVRFAEGNRAAVRDVERLAVSLGRKRAGSASVRAMVVGLPNVGKSTLINRFVGRSSAATGNRPGITRGKQWVRAGSGLDFLDLPGILVPGRLPTRVALRLALLGILPPQAFDAAEVACHALAVLEAAGRLPEELAGAGPGAPDGPAPEAAVTAAPGGAATRYAAMLDRYAVARGHLRAGGQPDIERAAVALVVAFREGRFGRITLEQPGESRPGDPGTGEARPGDREGPA